MYVLVPETVSLGAQVAIAGSDVAPGSIDALVPIVSNDGRRPGVSGPMGSAAQAASVVAMTAAPAARCIPFMYA